MTTDPAARAAALGWQPDNDVERAMLDALQRDDRRGYFQILISAELYIPRLLADPVDRARLFTVALFGGTFLPVFTSPAALERIFGPIADAYAATSYAELKEKWPDPSWRLAVNPNTPIDAYVDIDAVETTSTGELEIPVVLEAITDDMAQENVEHLEPVADAGPLLQEALDTGDADAYIRTLANAMITIPTAREVTEPAELYEASFPWIRKGTPPTIEVFTSPEAYRRLTGGTGPILTVYGWFAYAAWPPGCTLTLDPSAPYSIELDEEHVRELVHWDEPSEQSQEGTSTGRVAGRHGGTTAVLVYFRADREPPDHIRYQFGPTPNMDRYLMIHKPTLEGWPVDTIQNEVYRAAYDQIVYLHQQTGQWPQEGVVAS